MKKLSTNDFIEKAEKIHGSKYDYSLVEYINSKTKVKIICPEHGEFEQTPNNHYNHGCSICSAKMEKYNQKSTNKFIIDAKKIHGSKYDYSLVDYINAHKKVKIICTVHGVFEQKPNNHLNGQNCHLCYDTKLGLKKFIEKSKKIHNNKYDYLLILNYNSNTDKVKIICPIHGVFNQKISSHLSGHGCQKCAYVRNTYDINKFNDYKKQIRNKTKTIKNKLLENWDGYDYYDGEYIKNNYNLTPNNPNYPNIDHKISIYDGFINNIDADIMASTDNLCVTKKFHNLKKRTKSNIDYKKELEKI